MDFNTFLNQGASNKDAVLNSLALSGIPTPKAVVRGTVKSK